MFLEANMFLEVYGNKMHEPELIKHSLRCISSLSFLTKVFAQLQENSSHPSSREKENTCSLVCRRKPTAHDMLQNYPNGFKIVRYYLVNIGRGKFCIRSHLALQSKDPFILPNSLHYQFKLI